MLLVWAQSTFITHEPAAHPNIGRHEQAVEMTF
jgi:hypothetical protein